jgi:hypothetical protein
MTTAEMIALMESSGSPTEWAANARAVRRSVDPENEQAYPPDWYPTIIASGLVDRIHARWGDTGPTLAVTVLRAVTALPDTTRTMAADHCGEWLWDGHHYRHRDPACCGHLGAGRITFQTESTHPSRQPPQSARCSGCATHWRRANGRWETEAAP